jgi:HEPN domain-containing protein
MCGRATTGQTISPVIPTIASIIAGLTGADKVYFLHSRGENRHDFLALLPGRAQLSFRHYQSLAANACAEYSPVMLWCCHTALACNYLRTGHIFYSLACTPERLVYDSGLPMPGIGVINDSTAVGQAETAFYSGFTLAQSFLDGAGYYAGKGQLNAAAFSLHQAAEHTLRALLIALTGYNGRGHDLDVLLRHCQYCASSLCRVFPQDTEAEKDIFRSLNRAYLHARYKSGYTIPGTQLAELLSRVSSLQAQVRCLFEEQLLTFKTHIKCQKK